MSKKKVQTTPSPSRKKEASKVSLRTKAAIGRLIRQREQEEPEKNDKEAEVADTLLHIGEQEETLSNKRTPSSKSQ